MLKNLTNNVVLGAMLVALFTPAAFASPVGTDPEPRLTYTAPRTAAAFSSPVGTDPEPRSANSLLAASSHS